MPLTHILLAILVMILWGLNFIFVRLALNEMPPLLFGSIRFLLASMPAIFFIKPPAIPFRIVALYGLITYTLQFSLIFCGMQVGMTPGMASLILQVQVFFSMLLAALLLIELPSLFQLIGLFVSFTGILLIGLHVNNTASLLGYLMIIAAAAAWGSGNLIAKRAKNINMLALVVWGSFVACFPMFILSLLIEGSPRIIMSYQHITWLGFISLGYSAYASNVAGCALWNWLLSRHPVATITPFTLLVPIVSMLSSVIVLSEPFQHWKLQAGLLVIGGLCINLLGTRFRIANRRVIFHH